MNIRKRIVTEARKFINAPFHHSGRSSLGIDCAGLVSISYGRAGIDLPKGDGRQYTVAWWKRTKEERLLNGFLATGFKVLLNNELCNIGDIALFRIHGLKYPIHHCGIMLSSEYFIHPKSEFANYKFNKVTIDPLHPSYIKRLDCILTFKGL